MRQKIWLSLAAIAATMAFSGCAAPQREASTAVVVVPAQAAAPDQAAAPAIRSGTVVSVLQTGASAGGQGMAGSGGSSGAAGGAGIASSEQVVTVQFDDGQRQLFQVEAGGMQFEVGERVIVNNTQGTTIITR